MTQLVGLIYMTFRELWAKKVILGLAVVSTLVLIMVAFALNLDVVEGSLASLRLFGQEVEATGGDNGNGGQGGGLPFTLRELVVGVEVVVAGAMYWVGILLALFATAPLFSSVLERGHIDLLLSKPMSRPQFLGGHVLGVWVTVLALALYLLGGTWLLMSIKTGIWNPRFLLAIGIVVVMFGVMYGVIVAMGVFTESTALALIVTYGLIFASTVLAGGEQLASQIASTWRPVFWGFYHVLPNFTEVTRIVTRLARGEAIPSWYPLISSVLFSLACYGAAAWRFVRRDF
jgi:ABC-type transport system involved in multi-copper enzyme maturation permease subunit